MKKYKIFKRYKEDIWGNVVSFRSKKYLKFILLYLYKNKALDSSKVKEAFNFFKKSEAFKFKNDKVINIYAKNIYYKYRLNMRQKLKYFYGIKREFQFRRFIAKSLLLRGELEKRFITILENRVGSLLYRAGFFTNLFEMKNYVKKFGVLVSGKLVNSINFVLEIGDFLQFPDKNQFFEYFFINEFKNVSFKYKSVYRTPVTFLNKKFFFYLGVIKSIVFKRSIAKAIYYKGLYLFCLKKYYKDLRFIQLYKKYRRKCMILKIERQGYFVWLTNYVKKLVLNYICLMTNTLVTPHTTHLYTNKGHFLKKKENFAVGFLQYIIKKRKQFYSRPYEVVKKDLFFFFRNFIYKDVLLHYNSNFYIKYESYTNRTFSLFFIVHKVFFWEFFEKRFFIHFFSFNKNFLKKLSFQKEFIFEKLKKFGPNSNLVKSLFNSFFIIIKNVCISLVKTRSSLTLLEKTKLLSYLCSVKGFSKLLKDMYLSDFLKYESFIAYLRHLVLTEYLKITRLNYILERNLKNFKNSFDKSMFSTYDEYNSFLGSLKIFYKFCIYALFDRIYPYDVGKSVFKLPKKSYYFFKNNHYNFSQIKHKRRLKKKRYKIVYNKIKSLSFSKKKVEILEKTNEVLIDAIKYKLKKIGKFTFIKVKKKFKIIKFLNKKMTLAKISKKFFRIIKMFKKIFYIIPFKSKGGVSFISKYQSARRSSYKQMLRYFKIYLFLFPFLQENLIIEKKGNISKILSKGKINLNRKRRLKNKKGYTHFYLCFETLTIRVVDSPKLDELKFPFKVNFNDVLALYR